MDKGKFILYRNCGAVHHVSDFDRAPSFLAGDVDARPADDWRAFMNRHAGHGLEALKALGDQYVPDGSQADPMAVAYVEVTNGHRKFLLRRSRRSIDEPVRFERIEARFGEPMVAVEIQEREIRKELSLRASWPAGHRLSDEKIDRFIALFRDAVSQVDGRRLSAIEPSYADANVSYAALDERTKDSLLEKCACYFAPAEVEALRRFADNHGADSDVMTLLLRRRVPIEEQIYAR
jgi:hypothetical protein